MPDVDAGHVSDKPVVVPASAPYQLGCPEAAILTGGGDPHYSHGLTMALAAAGVSTDFIGSDELDSKAIRSTPGVRFLNFKGDQNPRSPLAKKAARICRYYARLMHYGAVSRARVFHILWNSRLEWFDRTLLMLFFKACGKRIVLTAHNINRGRRDGTDSVVNRLTLRFQYHAADHLFVHTRQMKEELVSEFGVYERKVTIIPFGVNNMVPNTALTTSEARSILGIAPEEKVVLFFGTIAAYKGLDMLVSALALAQSQGVHCRLIIAGQPKPGPAYLIEVRRRIQTLGLADWIIEDIGHVPDERAEIHFKAADMLALPYSAIFQSGVLFLAYSFGLPVVATGVGNFQEDVVEGITGHLSSGPTDAEFASAIRRYFDGPIYTDLQNARLRIAAHALKNHSWVSVAETTREIYRELNGEFPVHRELKIG
jgi:glycosyltransferase involved in cell wall biosynthesis